MSIFKKNHLFITTIMHTNYTKANIVYRNKKTLRNEYYILYKYPKMEKSGKIYIIYKKKIPDNHKQKLATFYRK